VVVTDKNLIGLDDKTREVLGRYLSSYQVQLEIRDNQSMGKPVVVSVYRRKSSSGP
jgi:hypothetical protein